MASTGMMLSYLLYSMHKDDQVWSVTYRMSVGPEITIYKLFKALGIKYIFFEKFKFGDT